MNKWMTWAAGLFALVATTMSGWLFIDDRFAKAEETQQQIDGIKHLYLNSERRSVQREKFQIEVQKQKSKLTPIEEQRLQQLTQEEKELTQQLDRVQKRNGP